MLKTVSKEDMYLICARLKNDAAHYLLGKNQTEKGKSAATDMTTVCNEMIDLLDQMPQLEQALKLQSLVKELHNHVHNH